MHVPEDIDRESPVPAYKQIAAALMRDIEAGVYRPGQRLPARDDLMHIFGVAKETAAKSLRYLISQGWAEKSTGVGTFVTGVPREGTQRAHDDD
jgi:DNA-binding GntR family transcriptional regulator